MNSLTVYWFRRDLRLDDNHTLHLALASGAPVLCQGESRYITFFRAYANNRDRMDLAATDGQYIKKWVAEFGTSKYPKPMVDHTLARRKA